MGEEDSKDPGETHEEGTTELRQEERHGSREGRNARKQPRAGRSGANRSGPNQGGGKVLGDERREKKGVDFNVYINPTK